MEADEPISPEERAACDRAMMRLDAEADALLAERPEYAEAIRALASFHPAPFRNRAADKMSNIVRLAIVEGIYHGFYAGRAFEAEARRAQGGGDA